MVCTHTFQFLTFIGKIFSIDFLFGLQRLRNGHDSIFVNMDKFSKWNIVLHDTKLMIHVLLVIYFSKKGLDYMGSQVVLFLTETLSSLVTFRGHYRAS